MYQRTQRAILGALAALLFAGCGGDDNGSSGPSSEQYFPARMVETFGSTGALLADYAVQAIDFNGTNVGFAPGSSRVSADPGALLGRFMPLVRLGGDRPRLGPWLVTSPTCNPTVTGDTVDTDVDGIPDDMLVEYTAANCTVTDTATGFVAVTRGTMRYRDTNNSLYGFDLTVTALRRDVYDGTSHDWTHQVISAHETAKTTSGGGTWALVIDANIMQGTGDTTTFTQQAKYDVAGTYTPSGGIPAAGPMPDGTVKVNGSLDATLQGSGRMNMTILTTTPLHYESSCTANDTGDMELRLNGNSAEGVHVKWVGCGNAAYEFLGSGVL